MLITKEMLEEPRSPAQLKKFVAEKRDEIEKNPAEQKAAYLKQGLYKYFVDELLQLGRLAEDLFAPEVLIRAVIGNQGFDAEVLDQEGRVIERIEVTLPHDGATAAKSAQKVVERGFGEIYTRPYGSSVLDPILDFVINTARNKASKDYSDCTVIIVGASGFPVYDAERAASIADAEKLVQALREMPWTARRVIVDLPDIERLYCVWPVEN